MAPVFIVSDNIVSPLGLSSTENFSRLKAGDTGVRLHHDSSISPAPFYASLFEKGNFSGSPGGFTKFEELLITSVSKALENSGVDIKDSKTVFILSSTKGNISLLEDPREHPSQLIKEAKTVERISLHGSAARIASYFGYPRLPLVVSNACISGLVGLLTAYRLLQAGLFENAVVAGCDIISKFIFSGFQSFLAVSSQPCKPFDADRDGITLGEAAATIVLSTHPTRSDHGIRLAGGSVSNDANHISGPSRTGEELYLAIKHAMEMAGLTHQDIDFISAHGTATLYNDEMEAKAISLAGMEDIPVHSLKGFYGHTLGAAGLIESVVSLQSLKEKILLPTPGFIHPGVSKPINISSKLQPLPEATGFLKTASGFGGCNAALVFST